jgi:hypothetical protein
MIIFFDRVSVFQDNFMAKVLLFTNLLLLVVHKSFTFSAGEAQQQSYSGGQSGSATNAPVARFSQHDLKQQQQAYQTTPIGELGDSTQSS